MPKVSKVQPPSARPGTARAQSSTNEKCVCARCGAVHKKYRTNFPSSQSPLFRGTGYIPVCYECFDELFMLYRDKLGSDAAAIRRMCLKFDIYWHPDCFAMVSKTNPNTSKIRSYMRFTNLIHFVGKTYDTTMEEEEALNNAYIVQQQAEAKEAKEAKIEEEFRKKHEPPPQTMPMPEPEVIAFWGPGFMPEFYADLEARYKKWTKDLQKPLPVAEEALYKQICIQEASINRNVLMGRSIESGQKALNELLGSLNAKPVQKSNDTTSEDNTPFGVWVRRFENEKPIPEPDPELKDVDGIIRYISIWFIFDRPHVQRCAWSTI